MRGKIDGGGVFRTRLSSAGSNRPRCALLRARIDQVHTLCLYTLQVRLQLQENISHRCRIQFHRRKGVNRISASASVHSLTSRQGPSSLREVCLDWSVT